MTDSVNLLCPNCDAVLEITPVTDRITCGQCGMDHIIHRAEGTVTLEPVGQTSTDKTASEAVIQRLEHEISDQNKLIQDIISHEIYRKNVFYGLSFLVGLIFTLSSIWAWFEYKVIIWIVFFIVGLLVTFMGAIAVRQQSRELSDQKIRLEERLQPYQASLERKQKQLNDHKTMIGIHQKPDDQ